MVVSFLKYIQDNVLSMCSKEFNKIGYYKIKSEMSFLDKIKKIFI